MLPLVNSVVMTLFVSIILILLYRINIVYGESEEEEPESESQNSPPVDDPPNPFPDGVSYGLPGLSPFITDSRFSDDGWQCNFNSGANLFGNQLLIQQLSQNNQIISAHFSFHNANGDPVCDSDGNAIEYTSSRHDLGHILDILHGGFSFDYAKCFLKLQPNSNFDPHSLLFHFAQSLTSITQGIITSAIIVGPTSFSIDSIGQMYNVSIDCPFKLTCMWLVDKDVISNTPNTTVLLIFDPKYVGNRTLSYVGYMSSVSNILASLGLYILPSTAQVCNNLPKTPKNTWLPAGTMSIPRTYLTATYLPNSGYIMIAGGTADDATALSSVDIYNPYTGCYNTSNMIYPRMQHTAILYNNSDIVLVMGGANQTGIAMSSSELISIIGSQVGQPMTQARYLHAIATLSNSGILIVAGQGFSNPAESLELYYRATLPYGPLGFSPRQLLNLVGHSVTTLGSRGTALIFGGTNGNTYFGTGLIVDQTNLTSAVSEGEPPLPISGRAYHRATYIPSIDAVLITGGTNGLAVFSDCYLYYPASQTFNATGSMQMARSFHATVLLSNGSVLVVGGVVGINQNQPNTITATVEIFDPSTGVFTYTNSLISARYQHAVILTNENEVFAIGGRGIDYKPLSSIEYIMLFDINTIVL